VVNAYYEEFKDMEVSAKIYNSDMTEKYSRRARVDMGPDAVARAFTIDWPEGLSKSHFLKLELKDSSGNIITDNFYWLSTKRDKPTRKFKGILPLMPISYADHTELKNLPQVKLDVTWNMEKSRDENIAHVTVKNPSDHLAFFIILAVTKGKGGMEVAPTFWSENMFSLIPGEQKTVSAAFYAEDLEGKDPVVRVEGWNIEQFECIPLK
jgi:exo-1,4-beta-D-glucosaminidase